MARTSTVVWSLIGIVLVILGALGLIYGPGLYREGKAVVGPIVDLAKTENRLVELNREFAFDEPEDGSVPEDRFEVFLEIRRQLLPTYREWQTVERALEKRNQEDWGTAKEVLAAIREVFAAQIASLRSHEMSPAEFIWIEDLVYVTWTEAVRAAIADNQATRRLRDTTAADLEALAELERRHGPSAVGRRFAERLEQRLRDLEADGPPSVAGISDATSAMLWAHRDEISALDFEAYSELHRAIRGNNVNIELDGGSGEPEHG